MNSPFLSQFSQLIKIFHSLGPEKFPLVEQTFFPNHKPMVSAFLISAYLRDVGWPYTSVSLVSEQLTACSLVIWTPHRSLHVLCLWKCLVFPREGSTSPGEFRAVGQVTKVLGVLWDTSNDILSWHPWNQRLDIKGKNIFIVKCYLQHTFPGTWFLL